MTQGEAIEILVSHFGGSILEALEEAQKTWPDGMPDEVSTAYVVAFDGFHQLFFGKASPAVGGKPIEEIGYQSDE